MPTFIMLLFSRYNGTSRNANQTPLQCRHASPSANVLRRVIGSNGTLFNQLRSRRKISKGPSSMANSSDNLKIARTSIDNRNHSFTLSPLRKYVCRVKPIQGSRDFSECLCKHLWYPHKFQVCSRQLHNGFR